MTAWQPAPLLKLPSYPLKSNKPGELSSPRRWPQRMLSNACAESPTMCSPCGAIPSLMRLAVTTKHFRKLQTKKSWNCWACLRTKQPMPELPEVEILVRHLAPLLKNKTIRKSVVYRARVLRPTSINALQSTLQGAKFVALSRRGKYLLFTLRTGSAGDALTLLGHLGL